VKLVHLVAFIIKKFVTIHGHMKRKIRFLYISYAIKTELLSLNITTGCTKIFEDLF